MKIVCSGLLIRHPVGGHTWHHLQYLIGLQRLGHQVTYFEDYGWRSSCYDADRDEMTADPSYGVAYLNRVLRSDPLEDRWCYLAEDGEAWGMSRQRLLKACQESDLYIDLSKVNWIPELHECRRRVLVDTDPVFMQIGVRGTTIPFSSFHALFTYGANVHRDGCDMPTGGAHWLSTRQPIVLDLWPVTRGDQTAPLTTITNWSPIPDYLSEGRRYGNKDRQFEPFFALPREIDERMEIVIGGVSGDDPAVARFVAGGWTLRDPLEISRDPWTYQAYFRDSRAEFSVAKHGYVATRSGWFGDRSAGYLASGRPVVIEDTGFPDWLPAGTGVVSFKTRHEAIAGIRDVNARYDLHCRAARAIAEEYFDARKVLTTLLAQAMDPSAADRGRVQQIPGGADSI